MSFQGDWQRFILGEGADSKNIFTYIQGLQEIISNIKPKTMTEERRLTLAKHHIREVRRSARKMQTEMQILQEKLTVLEESKSED